MDNSKLKYILNILHDMKKPEFNHLGVRTNYIEKKIVEITRIMIEAEEIEDEDYTVDEIDTALVTKQLPRKFNDINDVAEFILLGFEANEIKPNNLVMVLKIIDVNGKEWVEGMTDEEPNVFLNSMDKISCIMGLNGDMSFAIVSEDCEVHRKEEDIF